MSEAHVAQALALISEAIKGKQRAVVAYSGGKESVVLKHLLSPWHEQLEFVWANTGNMLPHMRAFVLTEGVRELPTNQAERFQLAGLPARIVPIVNTRFGMQSEAGPKDRLLVSDWVSCCAWLRERPIENYANASGLGLVIFGQRGEDGIAPHQQREGYPRRVAPLWDWTTEQVYSYIKAHELRLPEQYSMGYQKSGECWNCTAELNVERFKYISQRYPELWERLQPAVNAVYSTVASEWERYSSALRYAAESEKP